MGPRLRLGFGKFCLQPHLPPNPNSVTFT
jgi:hypothetical protein